MTSPGPGSSELIPREVAPIVAPEDLVVQMGDTELPVLDRIRAADDLCGRLGISDTADWGGNILDCTVILDFDPVALQAVLLHWPLHARPLYRGATHLALIDGAGPDGRLFIPDRQEDQAAMARVWGVIQKLREFQAAVVIAELAAQRAVVARSALGSAVLAAPQPPAAIRAPGLIEAPVALPAAVSVYSGTLTIAATELQPVARAAARADITTREADPDTSQQAIAATCVERIKDGIGRSIYELVFRQDMSPGAMVAIPEGSRAVVVGHDAAGKAFRVYIRPGVANVLHIWRMSSIDEQDTPNVLASGTHENVGSTAEFVLGESSVTLFNDPQVRVERIVVQVDRSDPRLPKSNIPTVSPADQGPIEVAEEELLQAWAATAEIDRDSRDRATRLAGFYGLPAPTQKGWRRWLSRRGSGAALGDTSWDGW